jgi:SprT-like family
VDARERPLRARSGPVFRALKQLLRRGLFDPAQLTLHLLGPDGGRTPVSDAARPAGRPTTRPRRVHPRRVRPPPAAVPPSEAPPPSLPATAARGPAPRGRRARTPGEADAAAVATLVARHAEYNVSRFGGALRSIPIDLSRRMRSRLGYYRLATPTMPAIIMVSRRHLRRHGWEEVFQTLLHEMVHQWQAESGHPVDHGPQFRAKARAVGAVPRARRPVGGASGRDQGGEGT